MTRSLRVAIVGAGLMGRWHAHACERAGGRVASVVDSDEIAAMRLARTSGAIAAASLDGVEPGFDAVHICTPPDTHVALVRRAMALSRSVIVEKPLAPTAGATESLLADASRRGVLIVPGHQLVFQDGVRQAERWVRGRPLRIFDYRVCSAGAGADPDAADHIAGEILPHPLSLVDAFMPGALAAMRWSVHRPAPGELAASSVAAGTTVRVVISMHARPPRHELMLFADAHTVTVDLFHGYAWKAAGTTSRAAKIARPFTNAAAAAATGAVNLARRSARGEPAYPGLTQLIERAYAALGNPPARPFTDDHILDIARARDAILRQRDSA